MLYQVTALVVSPSSIMKAPYRVTPQLRADSKDDALMKLEIWLKDSATELAINSEGSPELLELVEVDEETGKPAVIEVTPHNLTQLEQLVDKVAKLEAEKVELVDKVGQLEADLVVKVSKLETALAEEKAAHLKVTAELAALVRGPEPTDGETPEG